MIYWTYSELNSKYAIPGPFASMGEWMKKIGDSVTKSGVCNSENHKSMLLPHLSC